MVRSIAKSLRIVIALIIGLMFMLPDLQAQNYSTAAIPLELLKNANTVIREENKRFEVRSEKEGRLIYRKVVTLLNEESDADQLVIYYDEDSKVQNVAGWIYDAMGRKIRKLDKDEIQDIAAVDGFSIYQDNRIKYLEANYGTYPYTVVFEYEQTLSGISFAVFPDWYVASFNTSIQQAIFEVDAPEDFGLNYKVINMEVEPKITTDGKRVQYLWQMDDLTAIKREPYAPNPGLILPRILTAPSNFRIKKYQGSMDSWEHLGAFMDQLYSGRDQLPPEVASEIHNQVTGLTTNKQKIEKLYSYLQSTGADHEAFRYMTNYLSTEEQKEWLVENSDLSGLKILDLDISAAEKTPVSQFQYEVEVERLANRSGKRLFIPLNVVHPFNLVPREMEERKMPIVRTRGYIEKDTVHLQLPDGYQLESIPKELVELESEYGHYRLRVEKSAEADVLLVYRELRINPGEWPAEWYEAFRSFFLDLSRKESQLIVLVEKRT